MPKTVQVDLAWTCVKWLPTETWGRVLQPRLVNAGAEAKELNKSVYAIRLAGDFTIKYPVGDSPTVYIGEGSFGSRIQSHMAWASKLQDLVGKFAFEVCVATPRIKNQPKTYLDCEAVILRRFGERFGSAPLWNKQFERRRFPHHEYSLKKVDYVLGKRSGAKYQWALQPLQSSPFYYSYHKTHV